MLDIIPRHRTNDVIYFNPADMEFPIGFNILETIDPSKKHLVAAGIEYRWLPGLGGRRHGRPDSPHVAWQSASFRAYADHMETPEFQTALQRVIEQPIELSFVKHSLETTVARSAP